MSEEKERKLTDLQKIVECCKISSSFGLVFDIVESEFTLYRVIAYTDTIHVSVTVDEAFCFLNGFQWHNKLKELCKKSDK